MATATTSQSAALFDRVPPHDLEAERCVIGSCMLDCLVIDDVLTLLTEDCFYGDANRKIFHSLVGMYDGGTRAIDVVTIGHELERRSEFQDVGGAVYLNEVMASVPHAAHAEHYARIVREKWLQRTLIAACTDILRDVYHSSEKTEDVLARSEQRVFHIVEQQESTDKLAIRDILHKVFERYAERQDSTETTFGVPSGLVGVDGLTNGFQNSELVVLAARPSMGKTAIVCNFALHAASVNKGVLVFSLEQSQIELSERFLCIHARLDGHKLRQGELNDQERFDMEEGLNTLMSQPIFIDDAPGRTVTQIAAICRRMKRRHNIGIVIIDYLQLIESEDRNAPREQQVSTITRRLKYLAKDVGIPVIALAQLNRALEQREDKRPRLADLRESGAIEQDADVVLFLHRWDAYDPEDRPGEALLIVAKNRSGPVGQAPLTWIKEQLRFGDMASVAHVPDF